jgi:hypothetical protein
MTAPVRLWPQEVAKAAALLADQERFLSAVGQCDHGGEVVCTEPFQPSGAASFIGRGPGR